MKDEELLNQLQQNGLLDEVSAKKIKRETIVSGRSVEELLFEKQSVLDSKIAELKSRVLKVPYKKVETDKIGQDLLSLIPEETVRTYGVVPISRDNDLLVVGMLHPDNLKAQDAVKFIARSNRLSLGIYLISFEDWHEVMKKYSPYKSEIEAAVRSLNIRSGEGGRKLVRLEDTKSANEEAPVIRIVADTLKEAVQNRASDVHIEPQENYLRVRIRVDGELREEASLPQEISSLVVSRVKVLSNLKIDETRVPQDGRFRSRILDREIDFRVSTFPTPMGEKVAIRILDQSVGLKKFDDLGLEGRNMEVIKEGLARPFGMILVSGPTGSGKSTTLYALLQTMNTEKINIVSLEDPVEYFMSGINQSQVRPEIGYTFASGLRQILRQDPDVIMVGEIRDDETAGLAVHAALTGHVVLSTIHTNNAMGVIPRLIDMKVAPFLIPSAFSLMASQRLVSLLCSSCKKAVSAPEAIQKIIKQSLSNMPESVSVKFKEPYEIFRAEGCQKCNGRGFIGRIAIFEVLKMTPELENIINSGMDSDKISEEAKRQGMTSLRQDGIFKALEGIVSIEEVLRETEEAA